MELWAGKVIKCSELNELLCGRLNSAERNADVGALAFEISEENKDPIKNVHSISCINL